MALDVLAIGAHPDDIEIFAGATLAKFTRSGAKVGLLHLTRGELGSRGTPEQRFEEAHEAARRLGATFVEIADLGDGSLRDDHEARLAVVRAIREHRPNLLLAPSPSDDHPDHSACGGVAKAAWYVSGIRKWGNSGTEEPHRPDELWFYPSHEHLDIRFVVRVEEVDVETKMHAIAAYRSQFDETIAGEPRTRISDPRFLVAVKARSQHYGALVNSPFGEPFLTAKPLGISDLLPFARNGSGSR
jgi:bacillithiol biosynthesis deacetylase BshB1